MSEITELLRRLVGINSVNPTLVPGAPGETEIAEFVSEWLLDHGIEASIKKTSQKGRPNVIARVDGTSGGPSLLLNAHIDTVGIDAMEDPFDPRIENGRLYGRGALDTKGGLAAAMSAVAIMADERPPGDVVLTAVSDEEHGSIGTVATTHIEANGAIVYEPTDLGIVISHKGFVWLDVNVVGRAAHGSRPDLGIDAITKASAIVASIDSLNDEFSRMRDVPYLTRQSIHASIIAGGQERSSYADSCQVGFEVRTHPGTNSEQILSLVKDRIDDVTAEDPDIQATASLVLERAGLEGDAQSSVVLSLQQAITEVVGSPGDISGHDGWMDSALLAEAGIPSVVFGPSGEGLHAAIEWVDLESVKQCRDVTVRAAHLFGSPRN